MSISTEITRLQTARNTIRDKLIELGLSGSTATMDALATAVDGIENKGAVSASVQEGETYTIPKGYHNGSGTVSGVAGGGNYGLQSKVITPTKNQQSVTADKGFYGLSDVTVKPIPDAYQNVSGVTAGADDVLANKVIVDATGKTVAGTMPNNGAVAKVLDSSTDNQSYTIPKGYHNGSGKVSVSLEQKTATPTESTQQITPTSGKLLSSVQVNAIPEEYVNAKDTVAAIVEDTLTADAGSILKGEHAYVGDVNEGTVVKIVGTMPQRGAVTKTLDATANNQSYTVPAGYHNGSGKVSIVLETQTATPNKSAQDITPSEGKVLSKVTVAAIPKSYQDALDTVNGIISEAATITQTTSDEVLADKIVYVGDENQGDIVKVVGTMPNKGAVSATIDGLTTTEYAIPKGYHNGSGKVSLTDDIEKALAAI